MNAKIIKQKHFLRAAYEKLIQIEELENRLPFARNDEKIRAQISQSEQKYAEHLQMLFKEVTEDLGIKIIEPACV